MSSRRTLALALALGLGLTAFARAADVEITGLKLIIVDNLASTGKAKVVFVSKDPDIVKGPAGDPPGLTGSLEVFYTDATSNMGAFLMPDPWQINKDTVGKYVNKLAPAGGGVKVATVKPATVAKVVAKSLGDASQIDLFGGGHPGPGGITVVLTVANAYGEVTRMCTRFPTVGFYETGGGAGRKIVARNGVQTSCPEVAAGTTQVPSDAEPEHTPGSPGVDANDYPKLVTQFGDDEFSLNNGTYTRYYYSPLDGTQPDAILVLVPGFEGGAGSFKILAENLITHARVAGLNVELWAFDRRGHQIEDREGVNIAEAAVDPVIALDWFYGGELGLTLHPALVAGPNRRAIFHDTQADTAFIADWTGLVFSRDIDAAVEAARAAAKNQNVFLGGHSAGTGFTARYASTDFDLGGGGPAEAGYAKVRGLVLLEGGGGSTGGTPLTSDSLDRMEDRADGGLFYAVRDNLPRCGTAPMHSRPRRRLRRQGQGEVHRPDDGVRVIARAAQPADPRRA
jgi:pimeloyl-ACP methyl ester carboxylesterase